ncbi:MAG: alpha/beta hydrolase [Acholeplasmataceae bacterium]|nr:alpha/beta hydrolase [Acholeplasmataceae bacterium]
MSLERIDLMSPTIPIQGTLLLVHGAAVGAWSYGLFPAYAQRHGYDVINMSLRGHGQSDGKEAIHSYHLHDYVVDVLSVLDSIKGPVVVIAHSMGGAVLQSAMNQLPKAVKAVVLLSSPPPSGIKRTSPLGQYYTNQIGLMRQMRKSYPKNALSEMVGTYMFSNRLDKETVEAYRRRFDKESRRVSEDLLMPFSKVYTRTDIPVVVIGSSEDRLITTEDLHMTARHYQTTPVILEGMSHFMMLDPDWEYAANQILECLNKTISNLRSK